MVRFVRLPLPDDDEPVTTPYTRDADVIHFNPNPLPDAPRGLPADFFGDAAGQAAPG